ncbi:hypothetical protein A0U93_15215 [Neoasaia chiangmaiensis]|uniref:Uncharacterized protein n=1 Tax=Neoasaia chiangmaiensis TaxID=320497 RepID=A0A1U9KT80_9PROT|nr:hypothetical protein A0U93_15215 [Neoasaia chiangmaiensis]
MAQRHPATFFPWASPIPRETTKFRAAVPVHVRTGEAEPPPPHFDPLPELGASIRERPLLAPPMMPMKPGEPSIQ